MRADDYRAEMKDGFKMLETTEPDKSYLHILRHMKRIMLIFEGDEYLTYYDRVKRIEKVYKLRGLQV